MSEQPNANFTNVDPDEIRKFEDLASRWWDLKGEFKPLHMLNPLRCNYVDEASPVAGKDVLDVGCGGGILSEGLAQRGAKMVAIDMGEAPLEVARLHALESGLTIDYQHSAVEEFATKHQECFDIVCCMEMLEHVPDPASVIRACAGTLKPGGYLYLSTINRHPKAYAMAVLGAEYLLGMLPKGTHDYKKFLQPAELARCLRNDNLVLEDLCGIHYSPRRQNFYLHRSNVDVNYLLRARKPN